MDSSLLESNRPEASAMPHAALLGKVVDVHCHPTDAFPVSEDAVRRCAITVCAMSTGHHDQVDRVCSLATRHPDKVIPCFGYHPWLVHTISLSSSPVSKETHYRSLFDPSPNNEAIFSSLLHTLPDPTPLPTVLATLRANLTSFPSALLGEVGLDRTFRLPLSSPSEGARNRTPFTTPLAHQLVILEAQLELALELRRHMSMHSVRAQEATLELFDRMKTNWGERWESMSVDMHSCTLSVETWLAIERKHSNVYLSLSTVINLRNSSHRALLAACSPTRILVESDFDDIEQCAPRTWDMVQIVAEVRGWELEKDVWNEEDEKSGEGHGEGWGCVRRLESNWKRFLRGEPPKTNAETGRK